MIIIPSPKDMKTTVEVQHGGPQETLEEAQNHLMVKIPLWIGTGGTIIIEERMIAHQKGMIQKNSPRIGNWVYYLLFIKILLPL